MFLELVLLFLSISTLLLWSLLSLQLRFPKSHVYHISSFLIRSLVVYHCSDSKLTLSEHYIIITCYYSHDKFLSTVFKIGLHTLILPLISPQTTTYALFFSHNFVLPENFMLLCLCLDLLPPFSSHLEKKFFSSFKVQFEYLLWKFPLIIHLLSGT